jgi:hypothetical protein
LAISKGNQAMVGDGHAMGVATQILQHVFGATDNTAWIAYVNKGSISDASGTVKQNWLESAFLEKQAGTWKILFMHSTRVPMTAQVGY